MAKLTPVSQQLFGSGAGPDQIAQFGSLFAGAAAFTTDPAVMQSLSNWLTGWFGAAIGGNAPAIEDINSVCTVFAYQLASILQDGMPVWKADTTYYIGSLVNDGTGAIYVSKTDGNLNHATSDATFWTLVAGKVLSALGDLIYGGVDGALTALAGNTTTVPSILYSVGTGTAAQAPVWRSFKPPTVQRFTSGSGTYTKTSSDVLYLKVTVVGGGGGGSGSGAGPGVGGPGNPSTFGALVSGNGGTGGSNAGLVATGGTAAVNSPAVPIDIVTGGAGGGGQNQLSNGALTLSSGYGGNSIFAGGGPGAAFLQAGSNGAANSGGGGAGGGLNTTTSGPSGGGGGAGGAARAYVYTPATTYSYAVGSGGTSGTLGTSGSIGGLGGSGIIIVEEFYQ